MSERRCPRCAGLVGEDARWCGQCLQRLDVEDDAPAPAVPRADEDPSPARGPIEVDAGRPLWTCGSCGSRNEFEEDSCTTCGRPFSALFEEPEPAPRVPARRAGMLSLALPGLGHVAAGRVAEGVARFVVFAYALGTSLVILLGSAALRDGPLGPLGWLSVAGAIVVYVTAAVDAARAADRRDAVLSNRALLYGAIGLMMLTVIVLVVSGLRVTSARDGALAAAW